MQLALHPNNNRANRVSSWIKMTKVRQPDHIHKHIPGSSLLFKALPPEGRDDSPVSVIAHSAIISHSSSACTSMEHHIYQDAKLQLYQEPGYSTSDDDATYNNVTLSHEFLKGGTLESLPETHSFPLKLSPKKMGWGSEEARHKVQMSMSQVLETKDFSSDTDSAATGADANDESSAERFSIFCKEDDEISVDLFPVAGAKGVQDKKMLGRSDFWGRDADRLVHDDDSSKGSEGAILFRAKTRYSEWPKDQATDLQFKESPSVINSVSASREFQKRGLQLMKLANSNVSNKGFAEKLEEGQKKRYGSQGIAPGVSKTFPSPGTPSRSTFPGIHNSGTHGNQGGLNAGVSNGIPGKSVRALPNYIPGQNVKGGVSKALPSKWDDAEKWLVNADSPSHPQFRNGLPMASSASAKSVHGVSVVAKRSVNSGQSLPSIGSGKPTTECSLASGEMAGGVSFSYIHSQAAASDSELTRTPDCRALVRSNSQKYRQHVQAEKLARADAGKLDSMHKLRSSLDGAIGKKEAAPTRNMGTEMYTEPGRLLNDAKETAGSLMRGRAQDVQAVGSSSGRALWRLSNDGVERIIQVGTQTEILTQDKYADTVVETVRPGCSPVVKQEFVVQTPRHGRSASMKDASTEISPTVSRRDMGTQITPLGSSRTSRCPTPIKNNSPARHNTPARRSASWSNTGLNLLELESCHLAKLELRDLPAGSQFQSFDRSVSNWSTREEEEEESSTCLRPFDFGEVKKKSLEIKASAWEDAERAKFTAKFNREEAKIEAWENHQKAKAEAELKKLEMKLEKLRSQATEKIMNKLTAARRRAEEMRAVAEAQQSEQLVKVTERAASIRKNGHFPASFAVCFARMS